MSQTITAEAVRPDAEFGTFSKIPFGPVVRRLKPGTVKDLAALVRSSWVDPTGRRITLASNRQLAELAGLDDPETIARHLSKLAEIGAVSVEKSEGRRLVVAHERADGIGDNWINLPDDHPAWRLSPRAFVVYLGVCRYAGDSGACWPTDRRLAEFLCMSIDSVKRGLAELRKCMAVMTTSRFDPKRRSRKRLIHLTPAKRWTVATPAKPEPDPEPAPLKTSMVQKTGSDDRPESAEPIRNSAPEESGFLHPGDPVFCTIESESEDKKEPEHPLPPKLTGHAESEPESGGVVGSGDASPPPATEPKSDPADELIRRLEFEFGESRLNAIQKVEFKRALRALVQSQGPIPASWVEAALAVKPTPGTMDLGNVAIAKLRAWNALSADERADVPDATNNEKLSAMMHGLQDRLDALDSEPSKVIKSKFDGRERVQRADNTWANKTLPAENGSGTPAHVILAEREARWAAQREDDERMRLKQATPPPPPDQAELDRQQREKAEAERIKAEERERSRIEFHRAQVERELAEEVNRRQAAWTSRRTAELLGTMQNDLPGLRRKLAAERAIEAERIAAAVRAEYAPKLASLAPATGTPPPSRPALAVVRA